MSTVREVTDRASFTKGTTAGVGAYVVGYLITYLWQSEAIREQLQGINFLMELFGGTPISAWTAVGWYFYNAHFVKVLIPAFGGTRAVNFIESGDGGSFALLYVIPPLLLLLAGVAVSASSTTRDTSDGLVSGLTVVPAYLALALVGIVVFTYGAGGGESIHPNYVTAVLLAGLVYPAVFGGIGGAVGSLFD